MARAQRQPAGASLIAGGAVVDGTVDLTRDRDLVVRCQAGDRSAFEELYHRYHRRLFHFCQRRLQEAHEAEDAVQEAFTRAWRAMPNFAGERRFYPWLTVIAGNVCTDVLRRRSRVTPMDELPLPVVDVANGEIDEDLIGRVDAAMAIEALEHLSERHQRVLQLREGSGWSTQRLAEHEGVAVPAMETLLWRARQALKREFAALAESGGRLGVVIGLGAAAFRRFAGRLSSRVGERLPVLQSASASLRGPGTVVAGLVLAGGAVGGAILATGSHPGNVSTVSMPTMATDGSAAPAATSATATRSSSGENGAGVSDAPAPVGRGPTAGGSGTLATIGSAATGGGTSGGTGSAGSATPEIAQVSGGLQKAATGAVGSLGASLGGITGSGTTASPLTGAAGDVGTTVSTLVNTLGGVLGGLTGSGTGTSPAATGSTSSSALSGGLLGKS